ncbi:MAG: hypothetical protein HQ582_22145 [Planctomycetes bacterium]|nr:hypothetical protein [Planctomycetota bacterium]
MKPCDFCGNPCQPTHSKHLHGHDMCGSCIARAVVNFAEADAREKRLTYARRHFPYLACLLEDKP